MGVKFKIEAFLEKFEHLDLSFTFHKQVVGYNLFVLKEDPIDLSLFGQAQRIASVVELIAAKVGTKFLIAPPFEGNATFFAKALR